MNTNHPSSICSARFRAGLGAGCYFCGKGVSGRRGEGPDLRMARGPGRERQGQLPSLWGKERLDWEGLERAPNLRVLAPRWLPPLLHFYHSQVYSVGQDVPEPVFLPVPEPLFRFCWTTLRHLEQLVTKREKQGGSRGWGRRSPVCLVPRSSSPGGSGLAFAVQLCCWVAFSISHQSGKATLKIRGPSSAVALRFGSRPPTSPVKQEWQVSFILADSHPWLQTLALLTFLKSGETCFLPLWGWECS